MQFFQNKTALKRLKTYFTRSRKRGFWVLLSLFALILAIAPMQPVAGQMPIPLPASPSPAETPQPERPQLDYSRTEDLLHAPVKLDGQTLFRLAVNLKPEEPEVEAVKRLAQRIRSVESTLQEIVREDYNNPKQLEVVVRSVEQLPVLRATIDEQQWHLVTVTQPDTQLARQDLPLFDLAAVWRETLQTDLARALQERRPDAIATKTQQAGAIAAGTLLLSLLLFLFQKRAEARWKTLQEQSQNLEREAPSPEATPPKREFHLALPFYEIASNLPKLSLERQRSINRLIRQVLRWSNIALWYAAIVWILLLFPNTRQYGWLLLGKPLQVLGIWVFVTVVNKIDDLLIDRFMQEWVEFHSFGSTASQRRALRAPTFAAVVKGVTTFGIYAVGIFATASVLGIPIGSVLTVSALVGFAVTWGSQNLIKDTINGCLILLEDQYAVGDVIAVGEVAGLVEKMNLRITQLRNIEGELITIPNHAIEVVRNLSNGWSQVKFDIDIGYETDLDRAMALVAEVADTMYGESAWQDNILETPELLGVDRLDSSGVRISILLKTQPLKQWDVAREYRHRLKLAFDRAQIPMGMPQQSLWVKNYSSKENERRGEATGAVWQSN